MIAEVEECARAGRAIREVGEVIAMLGDVIGDAMGKGELASRAVERRDWLAWRLRRAEEKVRLLELKRLKQNEEAEGEVLNGDKAAEEKDEVTGVRGVTMGGSGGSG